MHIRIRVRALLAFTALALSPPLSLSAAVPFPPSVRISTSASIENGKTVAGGSGAFARLVEEGWLDKELARRGVKLEWIPVTANVGPIVNEAFASNRIDFAFYGDLPSIILNAAGVHTRVVVPSGRGLDVMLVVPASSSAKSLADLKGKRISIHRSRPWELGFQRLLRANGLDYRDFRIFNTDTGPGASALAAGSVDALFTISSSAYILEDKKVGRIIWSSREHPEYKMRAELWAAQRFIDAQPELTQVVVEAYVRAQHWISLDENREAAILDATRNGTPESVVRRGYESPSLRWRDYWSPLFDDRLEAHYRAAAQFAYERKLVRREVPADELADRRFVDAALRKLGLEQFWAPAPASIAAAPLDARVP